MRNLLERQVQAAWYDAEFRPRSLFTSRGSEVTVISPGEWNVGPGPDFRNAVLEIGKARRTVIGDVEIHLCPSDWDLHGHGTDPNYRNVVAHVTWRGGRTPQSLPEGSVSIYLGRFMGPEGLPSMESVRRLAYPYARLPSEARPCERTLSRSPELARKALAAAGRHRLRMKARRLLGLLCERPGARHQVFYEEVMAALGYSKNTEQFRTIARRVPLSELCPSGAPAEAALAAASLFVELNHTGIRPNNSPERRLANAAHLFADAGIVRFVDQTDFSPAACRQQVRELCSGRYMGKGRAGAVMANVIVPFAIAEGRMTKLPEWLPPEDISQPMRIAASRILGQDSEASEIYAGNDVLMQGLIQIHRDYCVKNHPFCEDCGLIRQSCASWAT